VEEEEQPVEEDEGRADEGEEEETEGETEVREDEEEGNEIGVVECRADEGERIPRMEREDGEAILIYVEGDNFDEEGDPVQAEWSLIGFIEYNVPDS
jgi:hypothetical protein